MVLLAITPEFDSTFSTLKLIGLIILCIAIIVACYYTTKFVGKKQGTGSGKNFRVIETYRISQNKFLQIIAVGKRYFLISSSKDKVSLIAELSESDLELEKQKVSHMKFKDALMASLAREKKKEIIAEKADDYDANDEIGSFESDNPDMIPSEEDSDDNPQENKEDAFSSEE